MNIFPFDLNGKPLQLDSQILDLLECMFEDEKKRGIMVKVFGEKDGHHFRIAEIMLNQFTLSPEATEDRIDEFNINFCNDFINFLDLEFELTPYN